MHRGQGLVGYPHQVSLGPRARSRPMPNRDRDRLGLFFFSFFFPFSRSLYGKRKMRGSGFGVLWSRDVEALRGEVDDNNRR